MTVPFLNLTALHAPLKEEMLKELEEVLDNSSFILGPKVQNFEKAFAEFCGVEHAMGVNSGTTALYMALLALNIGPGDEVIVPAMTFVATAEAVRYTGATPVFADVEEGRFTLDPALIEKCITPRTKRSCRYTSTVSWPTCPPSAPLPKSTASRSLRTRRRRMVRISTANVPDSGAISPVSVLSRQESRCLR